MSLGTEAPLDLWGQSLHHRKAEFPACPGSGHLSVIAIQTSSPCESD